MIVDAWWLNVIVLILVIVLFVCMLVLYLHMNTAQQKEGRNIALLSTGSVMFGLILIILVADIIIEYTRDTRSPMDKIREQANKNFRAPREPAEIELKDNQDNKYGTTRT